MSKLDSRFNRRLFHDFLKHLVVGVEIADAERTHLAHRNGFLHTQSELRHKQAIVELHIRDIGRTDIWIDVRCGN